MTAADKKRLTRPLHPIPAFVRRALLERGLMEAYRSRPAYQRNDYIGWINRGKLPETKKRRLGQMLEELERGDVYMKMKWTAPPRASRRGGAR
jgi:hypothetical protein